MLSSAARVAAVLAVVLVAPGAARAGDVTAELVKQTVVVRGDDLGAELVISRPPPMARGPALDSTVVIAPSGTTTVNGAAQPAVFSPVLNLRIELGDGPDSVQLIELNLAGDLFLDGGGGNNQLYLDGATVAGKCSFAGGDEPDLLSVAGTAGCGDDTRILLGNGINEVRLLAGSSFGGNLSLKLGSGGDEVTLDTAITGSAKLSLGEGDNTLNAPGSVGDDFSCKGGAGIDTLSFSAFEVGGRVNLKPGSGSNTLVLGAATTIGESLKFKAGAGSDTVVADQAQIGEDAVLVLSAGDNTVTVTNTTIGDDLVVKAKGGSDTLVNTDNTIGGETIVKGFP